MEYNVDVDLTLDDVRKQIDYNVEKYTKERISELIRPFGFKMPRRYTNSYANKVRRKLSALGYEFKTKESFDETTGIFEFEIFLQEKT